MTVTRYFVLSGYPASSFCFMPVEARFLGLTGKELEGRVCNQVTWFSQCLGLCVWAVHGHCFLPSESMSLDHPPQLPWSDKSLCLCGQSGHPWPEA